jgi:hypothetical protein
MEDLCISSQWEFSWSGSICWSLLLQEKTTFVFWITRCLGDRMRATKDVENNISIRATFPSSLLNIFAKGSVW